jgi:RNA polymerase sigma-70 factor (ECF subfamily)
LAAVHQSLYLMFNEGYATSHGDAAIREDLCEEAARLRGRSTISYRNQLL